MPIKSLVFASIVLALSTSSYALQQSASSAVGASATFTLSQKTQVPGATLKPGDYTIHVVDQMQDRMIVRMDSTATKDHASFLGVPHAGLSQGNAAGPLNWKSGTGGDPALRGFEFTPNFTVEFVYPKADAVALAKRNSETVVAVDPESEGKPRLNNMSAEDMQLIHLWMLSLTTAGPNDKTPAILAQKYQSAEASPAPMLARNTSGQDRTEVASIDRSTAPPRSSKPVIATLPHTASPLPLIALLGLFSFLAAGSLHIARILARPGR